MCVIDILQLEIMQNVMKDKNEWIKKMQNGEIKW